MYTRISQRSRPRCILFVFIVSLFFNCLLLLVWMRKYHGEDHLHVGAETSTGDEGLIAVKKTLQSLQASVDAAICGRPRATFFNGSNWLHLADWRSPSESFYSFEMRIISRGWDEQLILAEWDTLRPQKGDFLSIYIKGGRLVFMFDPGRGLTEVIHPNPMPHNTWCEVMAWRKQKEAGLAVNGVSVRTPIYGTAAEVNSDSGLYLGGVPVSSTPYVIPKGGFLGCVSNLQLNNNSLELWK